MELKGYYNLDGWSNKLYLSNVRGLANNITITCYQEESDLILHTKELKISGSELFILDLNREAAIAGKKGIMKISSTHKLGCTMILQNKDGRFIEYRLTRVPLPRRHPSSSKNVDNKNG